MCGRYALGLRAAFIRHRIRDNGMPVDDFPDDDEVRESYNFAPGYNGIVYRADTPPSGAGLHHHQQQHQQQQGHADHRGDAVEAGHAGEEDKNEEEIHEQQQQRHDGQQEEDEAARGGSKDSSSFSPVKYKLQAMKWGLVPFWTKRDPGYGGLMKTINCRDDSLAASGGMWAPMKRNKRCVVLAQGFYEWQKKDGGRTKVPHFVRRRDGQLMCFAGLWDCVRYESKGGDEGQQQQQQQPLWTYTIVTTDVNQRLSFLHDRMPVILDNGSDGLRTWLDPKRTEWTTELQALLKPFDGELDVYPVNQEVGKVGNNSPDFIVPVDSSENKRNIANFFGNAKAKQNKGDKLGTKSGKGSASSEGAKQSEGDQLDTKSSQGSISAGGPKQDNRETINVERSEDNAPMPVPQGAVGHKHGKDDEDAHETPTKKQMKVEHAGPREKQAKMAPSPTKKGSSPTKSAGRKTRSATSNGSARRQGNEKAAAGGGSNHKITDFLIK